MLSVGLYAGLVSFSVCQDLDDLHKRQTYESRKLCVQARVDEDTRSQYRSCADHVLLRLDGVRFVVQEITDNGPGHLTRRCVELELGTLGVRTHLEELVVVLWLRQVTQDRGRAGPFNVLPVRLIPITGQWHAGELSPSRLVRIQKDMLDELVADGFVESRSVGAEERLCFMI